MKRNGLFRATAFGAVFFGSFASAGIPEAYAGNPILEALNQQLIAEGFEIVSIKTTFLRRYKIEAHAPGIDREIVLAPGTGAILRDEQEVVSIEPLETGSNGAVISDDQGGNEAVPPNDEPSDTQAPDTGSDNEGGDSQDEPRPDDAESDESHSE